MLLCGVVLHCLVQCVLYVLYCILYIAYCIAFCIAGTGSSATLTLYDENTDGYKNKMCGGNDLNDQDQVIHPFS